MILWNFEIVKQVKMYVMFDDIFWFFEDNENNIKEGGCLIHDNYVETFWFFSLNIVQHLRNINIILSIIVFFSFSHNRKAWYCAVYSFFQGSLHTKESSVFMKLYMENKESFFSSACRYMATCWESKKTIHN